MTPRWYEPFNLTEWLKRSFSFANILVFLCTAMLFFSEFRFDWIEKMVGSYLMTTNTQRQEKGLIWKTGRQASNAHEYLNTIVDKKADTLESVHQAVSFSQLAASVLPGEWIPVEKQLFKTLYLSLDTTLASKLIEPAHLVWLLNSDLLDRIFCEGRSKGLNIYFTDSKNRVIKKIEMEKSQIVQMESGVRPVQGPLEQVPGFTGRIYSADRFFQAVLTLPADILPDLISYPEMLLRQDKKIIRVGVWNESENGYIRLGFELQGDRSRQVLFMKSREWAVWQLTLNLKGEDR